MEISLLHNTDSGVVLEMVISLFFVAGLLKSMNFFMLVCLYVRLGSLLSDFLSLPFVFLPFCCSFYLFFLFLSFSLYFVPYFGFGSGSWCVISSVDTSFYIFSNPSAVWFRFFTLPPLYHCYIQGLLLRSRRTDAWQQVLCIWRRLILSSLHPHLSVVQKEGVPWPRIVLRSTLSQLMTGNRTHHWRRPDPPMTSHNAHEERRRHQINLDFSCPAWSCFTACLGFPWGTRGMSPVRRTLLACADNIWLPPLVRLSALAYCKQFQSLQRRCLTVSSPTLDQDTCPIPPNRGCLVLFFYINEKENLKQNQSMCMYDLSTSPGWRLLCTT